MTTIILEETSNSNGTGKKSHLRGMDGSALVGSVQKKFRDSFTSPLTDNWDVTLSGGVTAANSAVVLTIASGTTAGGYAELLTKETFTIPFRAMFGVQSGATRQANTHHIMEIVSVDRTTGLPDGRHSIDLDIGGAASATVTQAVYGTQNGGLTPLLSAASTIVSTATYSGLELEPFADEAYWHSRTIDATTGRANSYVRHQQIPDPTALYKVRIRSMNHAAWKTVTGAVAGTGGVIRLTVATHGYSTSNVVWVEALNGVLNGTAAVRGNYTITSVDANTIELQGTTFAGAYVTGSGRVALAAAPAAINLQFQFVTVQDYAELTAEITAGRGQIVQGQSMGVAVTAPLPAGTAAIGTLGAGVAAIGDVGVQYRANATGAASRTHIVSAASTNSTLVKNAAGRLIGVCLSNTSAAYKFVKFHNQATAPTAGTSVVQTVAIPPNGNVNFHSEGGVAFTIGIGLTITNLAADADATAVAAGDVVGDVFFA